MAAEESMVEYKFTEMRSHCYLIGHKKFGAQHPCGPIFGGRDD